MVLVFISGGSLEIMLIDDSNMLHVIFGACDGVVKFGEHVEKVVVIIVDYCEDNSGRG